MNANAMKLRRNSRPPALAKGQIWKLDEGHLEITHLGKRLTEFKRYRDIAIAFKFGEALSEMCDLKMPFVQFPDLPFGQRWWPTIPSQFHSVCVHLGSGMEPPLRRHSSAIPLR